MGPFWITGIKTDITRSSFTKEKNTFPPFTIHTSDAGSAVEFPKREGED